MLLNNQIRPIRARFAFPLTGTMLLLTLNPIHSFALQSQVMGCGKFANFPTLNSRSVDSHILKKVYVSNPLLGTAAINAIVTVRVFVDRKGDVICARALGSENALLKSLAEQAAMKWKFLPYIQQGTKNPFQGNVRFHIIQ